MVSCQGKPVAIIFGALMLHLVSAQNGKKLIHFLSLELEIELSLVLLMYGFGGREKKRIPSG